MSAEATHRAVMRLSAGEDAETLPAGADALRRWLADRIAWLLAHHPALLMSHLYRVDVREADVQAALASPDPPVALAGALIAREIEKERYRDHYAPDDRLR